MLRDNTGSSLLADVLNDCKYILAQIDGKEVSWQIQDEQPADEYELADDSLKETNNDITQDTYDEFITEKLDVTHQDQWDDSTITRSIKMKVFQ